MSTAEWLKRLGVLVAMHRAEEPDHGTYAHEHWASVLEDLRQAAHAVEPPAESSDHVVWEQLMTIFDVVPQ